MGCIASKGGGGARESGDYGSGDQGGWPPGDADAYLSFDPTSNGTLFLHWTTAEVPDAIAYARVSGVPAGKFKGGGRSELVRNIQANKQDWFRGFCEFVKAVRVYGGYVTIYPDAMADRIPTELVFHRTEGNKVEKADPEGYLDTNGTDAVAAVPKGNTSLDVGNMNITLFCQKGVAAGMAIQFDNN